MRVVFAVATLVALAGCATAATDPLTDNDLVTRASTVMSVKEAPADRMLGVHKGAAVIVDVRCSDICPQYTVRIVHYMVAAGPDCLKLGGDNVGIAVPRGIATGSESFCIPHVLYQQKLYVDHPFQK